jgi:uroporphyrin-3 C-methyltransferase
MTEQQNQSAVVEETREAVEPHHSQRIRKEEGGNKTSLALSAIAIAIAIAAGVGLYGLNKQQATRQNHPELSPIAAALQKAQESQK